VSAFPNLSTGLVGRGWPDDAIRKVLGENTLRVLAEAGSPPAAQAP
jgi:microsomal dipeptidase-like Zn-dependent dipeptidase